MGKYTGCKCLSCGIAFNDPDDVVVCPECGTPYHRDCYEKEGGCINHELHETGAGWRPEHETAGASDEPVRCSRCGQENPPEGLFCNRCGLPLHVDSDEPRPFNDMNSQYNGGTYNVRNGMNVASPFSQQQNSAMRFDQDSDIDGVKLGDYARFVGKNQFPFLANFIRFGKFGGKASLNIAALLFPQFYFFYRKMPLIGALYMLVSMALSIPMFMVLSLGEYLPRIGFVTESFIKSESFTMVFNITSSMLMVTQCVAAIFANYWYYRKARKSIIAIRRRAEGNDISEETETEVRGTISQNGGVSWSAFIMSVLVFYALAVLSIFVMNKF